MSAVIYYIMGVSGSGKTTVGKALADRLGIAFFDGDDFHPAVNRQKMAAGIPLTDEDRWGWLQSLQQQALAVAAKGNAAVLACSALKESYRSILRQHIACPIVWVHLTGSYEVLADRLQKRSGHFMPSSLLPSQLAIWEPPVYGLSLSINQSIEEMVNTIIENAPLSDWGLAGLGVMGKSLARNFASKGIQLSLYNRFVAGTEEQVAEKAIASHPELTHAKGFEDLTTFVVSLKKPRKIFIMIPAGDATDAFIAAIAPLLEAGDILVDGGNALYSDTQRRMEALAQRSIHLIGVGVSGGEQGALLGPSIMPSGDSTAYRQVEATLCAIAAKDNQGNPCCTYIGPAGAGHFVKMIHNGIEYAEMQLIAEVYAVLRYLLGQPPASIAQIFTEWNGTELKSYLLESTATILAHKEGDIPLVDLILDKAGSKGTGNWATIAGLQLGVPCTLMTAALFARYQSTIKEQYKSLHLPTPLQPAQANIDIATLRNAYALARLVNHQQGFMLLQQAALTYQWPLSLSAIARIWTGGCIIKSVLMERLADGLVNHTDVFAAPHILAQITSQQPALRALCAQGIAHQLPLPVHQAANDYASALQTPFATANILQAQRDFFGAHGYERVDDSSGKQYHTEW